ncbi:DMT family transporter [Kiloniella sp.]|uniref:DMT family transporter n=1 Tax=Kiloniella sp. TaxID=1938587 RepID=UPI003B01B192
MGLQIKLFLLTSLTMVAFAANSIFNRLSLAEGEIGPSGFALIRVLSGAAILLFLVSFKGPEKVPVKSTPAHKKPKINLTSILSLSVYILGFSFAYVSLDAGIGALILFGGVQITMFVGALYTGEKITRQRWFGSILAIAGLVWLLAPTGVTPLLFETLLMAGAAIGWGVYSLIGRKVENPLVATQKSFLFAIPLVALIWFAFPDQIELTQRGVFFAIASGAITSGLGYALWYSVLPRLDTITASVAQLTVPALAMMGGAIFLSEPITLRFLISAALIMAGVIIAVKKR